MINLQKSFTENQPKNDENSTQETAHALADVTTEIVTTENVTKKEEVIEQNGVPIPPLQLHFQEMINEETKSETNKETTTGKPDIPDFDPIEIHED